MQGHARSLHLGVSTTQTELHLPDFGKHFRLSSSLPKSIGQQMGFRSLHFPTVLDTSSHDLIAEFFVPALRNAVQYNRGVGFFTSGWLRAASEGMVHFANNSGHARWITSPILQPGDWIALTEGVAARSDPNLQKIIERNIADLATTLERDTLSALAWMVADEILDFKLALPRNSLHGEFHAKFGVFTDEDGNQVCFNGSYNDSQHGLLNYESIFVFSSWYPEFHVLTQDTSNRFERLWNNQDPNVRVFELPEAAREQIVQLREQDRPYNAPTWIAVSAVTHTKRWDLWPHQQDAITAWEENGRTGLLNMATGSGKTLTALNAAERCPDPTFLVIAVPTSNLVEQWAMEIRLFDFLDPILVYRNSELWQDRLFNRMRAAHSRDWPEPIVIVGTLQSLSSDRFLSVVNDAKIPSRSLLIADEVHNVGAPTYCRIMLSEFDWRLGLSATPERHFDEEGSAAITDFFGPVVFTYSLGQALEDERLTPYSYYVYVAELSADEYDEYLRLTRQIVTLRGQLGDQTVTFQTNNKLDSDSEHVEQLLFKRARILKKSSKKYQVLRQVLQEHPPQRCLIYCADNEQLNEVSAILNSEQIVHLKYTAATPPEERRQTLRALEKGRLPVLAAINCLDEGVDIPSVDMAIILASSTNSRQFIQRRGRILRRSEGKTKAILIDLIAVPPRSVGVEGKWMLRGELARAKEMAELADNRFQALLQIKSYTDAYGVMMTELLTGDSHG